MTAIQTRDGWVLSDNDQWLPGVFATREAALHAAVFSPEPEIDRLQEIANKREGDDHGKITMEDLTMLWNV